MRILPLPSIVESKSAILSNALAEQVLTEASARINEAIAASEGRNCLHVVIAYAPHPFSLGRNDNVGPLPMIAERTFGENDKRKWLRAFDHVAYTKAYRAWECQMSGGEIQQFPWRVHVGHPKFQGFVYSGGLIITASGLQAPEDQENCESLLIDTRGICTTKLAADLGTEGVWYHETGQLTANSPISD